jgi:hypothetical protein
VAVQTPEIVEVDALAASQRADGGFGHRGTLSAPPVPGTPPNGPGRPLLPRAPPLYTR